MGNAKVPCHGGVLQCSFCSDRWKEPLALEVERLSKGLRLIQDRRSEA